MSGGTDVEGVRNHLAALQANEDFVARVLARDDAQDFGWAVTSVFYSAVHVVRAYLKASSCTVSSHDEVEKYFHQRPEIRNGKDDYKTLKQLSEGHRYYHVTMTRKNVEDCVGLLTTLKNIVLPKAKKKCPDAFVAPAPVPAAQA